MGEYNHLLRFLRYPRTTNEEHIKIIKNIKTTGKSSHY